MSVIINLKKLLLLLYAKLELSAELLDSNETVWLESIGTTVWVKTTYQKRRRQEETSCCPVVVAW